MASILDLRDPEPTFHTAECMLAMGLVTEATEALQMVVKQTETKPDYQAMNQRAKVILDAISNAAEKGRSAP